MDQPDRAHLDERRVETIDGELLALGCLEHQLPAAALGTVDDGTNPKAERRTLLADGLEGDVADLGILAGSHVGEGANAPLPR